MRMSTAPPAMRALFSWLVRRKEGCRKVVIRRGAVSLACLKELSVPIVIRLIDKPAQSLEAPAIGLLRLAIDLRSASRYQPDG